MLSSHHQPVSGWLWFQIAGTKVLRARLCSFYMCFSFLCWRRKWQTTPVFLPRKSHGWRSLVQATVHGVAKSRTWLSNFTSLPFSAGSLRFVFSSHFIQRMSCENVIFKNEFIRMAATKKSTNNKWRGWREKGTLLHCWWEWKLVQSLWRTVWWFLKNLEIEQSYDPEIPLLGMHTKEIRIERDTCTPMFIAALFIIARTWKQPRCPSADEWIRKLYGTDTQWNIIQL